MTPRVPRIAGVALLAIGVAAAGPPSRAQQVDVTGSWEVAIEQGRPACRWEGTVTLVQDGTRLAGRGTAAAVTGGRRCPPLSGRIRGTVTGAEIRFGFAMGAGGEARFEGEIEAGARTMTGAWSRPLGAGAWRADR